ncbi:MAG: hypothetical protein GY719_31165 [bacterium]|nr:hypothetical protein [bacterium]
MLIAEALRLLRTRRGLTQAAAAKPQEAPDFRTLSHWETRHKTPSLKLLDRYLQSLGFDFCDLQEALDLAEGRAPKQVREELKGLRGQVTDHEERLLRLEVGGNGDEEVVRNE